MSPMVNKVVIAIASLLLIVLAYQYWTSETSAATGSPIKVEVERGILEVEVRATGELQAKNSTKITGPSAMRSAGIFRTTISDMVPEGTVVKEGDFVATLDRSEVTNQIQSSESEIERIETQLVQLRIDTAIELQGLRDQLLNQQFVLEERQIQLAQSKYEPQMTIRQAEIDFQRAQRDYDQMVSRYELKQEQAIAKIAEINSLLRQEQYKLENLNQLAEEFTVRSPGPGMIIYQRSWGGRKGPGSEVTAWDPTVAELPDLSEFVSMTFVNEIDISKVSPGQDVTVTVDAFPENIFEGKVTDVANIGQQLRSQDARVFEVTIQLLNSDSLLRPAMTTGNRILINRYEDVLKLPLEAIFEDSLTYVIKEDNNKIVKQEIIKGDANDLHFIVAIGLEMGDQVYLSYDGDKEELPLVKLDPGEREKIVQELRMDRKNREEERRRKGREVMENSKDKRRSVEREQGVIITIN